MKAEKIRAGSDFPEISAHSLDGEQVPLKQRANGADWKMVVVYRGVPLPALHPVSQRAGVFQG